MTDLQLENHNKVKRTELHPVFGVKIGNIIVRMRDEFNHRCRIQCAYRNKAKQLEAYNTGHSGVKFGMHNATGKDEKPESLAVDMLEDDYLFRADQMYYIHLARCARDEGLITGILWKLKYNIRNVLDQVISDIKITEYSGKIGFDPSHIQYDISTLRVRLGWRPRFSKFTKRG